MIHDLREWLGRVEGGGEPVCIDKPVEPVEAMGAITYLVARQTPSPAVVFENPHGPNAIGSQNPPEERPYGSKALINACKEHRYLPVFSKRTALRREMYDRVASRWSELGLIGQAPTVRVFETEQPVVYHEEGRFEPGQHSKQNGATR